VDEDVARAVALAVEERVGDVDRDLVPQLRRPERVGADEDVGQGVRSYGNFVRFS
jgi:hypothetical protein